MMKNRNLLAWVQGIMVLFLWGCSEDSLTRPTSWSIQEEGMEDMRTEFDSELWAPDMEKSDMVKQTLERSGVWTMSNDLPLGSIVQDTYSFEEGGLLLVLPQNPSYRPAGRVAQCALPGCPPRVDTGGSPCEDIPGGVPDVDVFCVIAESWKSEAQDSLELGLSCTDEIPRFAQFSVSPGENGEGYVLELQNVSGDKDWITFSHAGPRCPLLLSPSSD
jgi:hypothetical protein